MKLTDNLLRRLPTPARGNKITYDDAVKGFGCRVTAAGGRAFILNYRRKLDGRERLYTIGSFPDWGTTAAREEAKRLKRAIDGGSDPVGEQEENRAAATVADLAGRFEQRARRPRARRRAAALIGTPGLSQVLECVIFDDPSAWRAGAPSRREAEGSLLQGRTIGLEQFPRA